MYQCITYGRQCSQNYFLTVFGRHESPKAADYFWIAASSVQSSESIFGSKLRKLIYFFKKKKLIILIRSCPCSRGGCKGKIVPAWKVIRKKIRILLDVKIEGLFWLKIPYAPSYFKKSFYCHTSFKEINFQTYQENVFEFFPPTSLQYFEILLIRIKNVKIIVFNNINIHFRIEDSRLWLSFLMIILSIRLIFYHIQIILGKVTA